MRRQAISASCAFPPWVMSPMLYPVVRAIKAHWPDTKISWILGSLEHKLLKNLAESSSFLLTNGVAWPQFANYNNKMQNREFDVLLHMQVAARANILSRLIKARVRLGWDRARSRDRHHWFVNHSVESVPFQHQVEGFLEFARSLGIAAPTPQWQLPVSEEDRSWAESKLAVTNPILMISACSSHVLRNWRSECYAQVADRAIAELGMSVVLIGGPGELDKRTAAEIQQHMHGQALNLAGKDTLGQSMALMEKAAVLISPDSGPAHIASALDTPVIGLYAATWSKRSGPYNSLDLCVDRFEDATRKFRHKEARDLRWGTRIEVPGVMDLIEPDTVFEKLKQFRSVQNTA